LGEEVPWTPRAAWPRTLLAKTLFPEPDSLTMASISPRPTNKRTPSTALTPPKRTLKSDMVRSFSGILGSLHVWGLFRGLLNPLSFRGPERPGPPALRLSFLSLLSAWRLFVSLFLFSPPPLAGPRPRLAFAVLRPLAKARSWARRLWRPTR
jgi:hypothetical protein